MQDKTVFDSIFDLDDSSDYELYFQVFEDSFSYLIYSPKDKRFVAFEYFKPSGISPSEFPLAFQTYCDENELFTLPYQKISVLVYSNKSTLVPKTLFSKEEAEKYLYFNFVKEEGETVYHNTIKGSDIENVFSIPTFLHDKITDIFQTYVIFQQQTAPIISNIIQNNKNKSVRPKVYVNVRLRHIDIFVTNSAKLLLSNSFEYSNEKDFCYFIMLIYEQLKLNPENTDLILCGRISRYSELYKSVYKYIRTVEMYSFENPELIPLSMNDINVSRFAALFNAFKCV